MQIYDILVGLRLKNQIRYISLKNQQQNIKAYQFGTVQDKIFQTYEFIILNKHSTKEILHEH